MNNQVIVNNSSLNLNISGYEGPLDLLLELSKKQKLDITKISILELANQYLDFIKKKVNDINLSADYLVMASFLAYLKSKLLLPKEIEDGVKELEEDLTKRLIHYNAIKIASKKINDLFQENIDFYTKKAKSEFFISNKIVINVNFKDLLKTYLQIQRVKNKLNFQMQKNKYFSVEDAFNWLSSLFNNKIKNWITIMEFLPINLDSIKMKKSACVSTLLASLIMVKDGKLEILQNEAFKEIKIKIKE